MKTRLCRGSNTKNVKLIIKEIKSLMEKNDDKITPEQLIVFAKNKKTTLHYCFEWDDTVAAEKYRLVQARTILASVQVEIEYDGGKSWSNLFVNVKDEQDRNSYVTIETAFNDVDLRKQVISTAIRELEYWKKKYEVYGEFKKIMKPLSKFLMEVQFLN